MDGHGATGVEHAAAGATNAGRIAREGAVLDGHGAEVKHAAATGLSPPTHRGLLQRQISTAIHSKDTEVRCSTIPLYRTVMTLNGDLTADHRQPCRSIGAVVDGGEGVRTTILQYERVRPAACRAAARGRVSVRRRDSIEQGTSPTDIEGGCQGLSLPQGQQQGYAGQGLLPLPLQGPPHPPGQGP